MSRELEFPDDFRFSDGVGAQDPATLAALVEEEPDRADELMRHLKQGDLTRWLRMIGQEQRSQQIEALRRREENASLEEVLDVLAPEEIRQRARVEDATRGNPDETAQVSETSVASDRAKAGSRTTGGGAVPSDPSGEGPYESRVVPRQRELIRGFWQAGERRQEEEEEIRERAARRRGELRRTAEERREEIHQRLAEARTTLEDAQEARERVEREWNEQKEALRAALLFVGILAVMTLLMLYQARSSNPNPGPVLQDEPAETRGAEANGTPGRFGSGGEGNGSSRGGGEAPNKGGGGEVAVGATTAVEEDESPLSGMELVRRADARLPGTLDSVYAALDRGDPSLAAPHITADLRRRSETLGAICRPGRHRAFYIRSVAALGPDRVRAVVHHLDDADRERVYALDFVRRGERFVLVKVRVGERWTHRLLEDRLSEAEERAQRLVRAAADGRSDVVASLTTAGFRRDFGRLGNWDRLTRGGRIVRGVSAGARVVRTPALRPRVEVSLTAVGEGDGEWVHFQMDFARVDGELRVVRLLDERGRTAAVDPAMGKFVARRFGLPAGTVETDVSVDPADDLPIALKPASVLSSLAKAAAEDGRHRDAVTYAREAVVAGVEDEAASVILLFALYLTGEEDELERQARRLVRRGRRAPFTLYHHHGSVFGASLHPARLAISTDSLAYEAFGECEHGQFVVPLEALREVRLEGSRTQNLFLHLEIAHRNTATGTEQDVTLNMAGLGAGTGRGSESVGPLSIQGEVVTSRPGTRRLLEAIQQVINWAGRN